MRGPQPPGPPAPRQPPETERKPFSKRLDSGGEPRAYLLGVHEAVVVQVAAVGGEGGGEAGPQAAAEAGPALEALAHHQRGVVERALGALSRRVHAHHEDDVHDDLEVTGETGGGARVIGRPLSSGFPAVGRLT